MDDQQDKELSKHIKEVFDKYDDASADEGWLKLREKFPEERNRRGIIWLWPAAAVLLIFIGIGLVMLFNTRKPVEHIAKTKPSEQGRSIQNTRKDNIIAQRKVSPDQTDKQNRSQSRSTGKNIAANEKRKNRSFIDTNAAAKNQAARSAVKANIALANDQTVKRPVNSANPGNPAKIAQTQSSNKPSQGNVLPTGITSNQSSPLLANVDTAKKKSIVINNTPQQIAVVGKPDIVQKDTSASKTAVAAKKPSSIEEMFAADQGKAPDQLDTKTNRHVKFGVYAATYVNYAKNGTNQVNGGGGFMAAIPLNKNLRLVTGASVNQNSFNYNNQTLFAPAFPAAAMYLNVPSNFSSTSSASYSHDASLLGIDVPLDLQYEFNTRKYPFYILGGVSSGTFINESYGYVYPDGSTQQQQSYKGLNDFYFARTLNFGFGVGYPIGKSQLIFEPFVKYPLTGMGAQELKFGASGINLKFNFPTK
jgi:hypothetical protein